MKKIFGWGAVFAASIVGYSSTFTVWEYEQVVLTRFGEIQGDPIMEPGLHFKAPFIDQVLHFDKRWLAWVGDANEIPTRDKKYIWVDAYARWRISDPVLFYMRLRDIRGAQSRLDDIIDGEVRNVIANHDLIEIVRSNSRQFAIEEDSDNSESKPATFAVKYGRDKLRNLILEKSSSVMPNYGIELADVQIKRVNYVQSVQLKVFDRMISERKRIAERYRSEGLGKSAAMLGKIDRELKAIESEAKRKGTEIRGHADAVAADIYANAYNRDPDFYRFFKTLESYRKTIDDNTSLVMSTESELLQTLTTSLESAR